MHFNKNSQVEDYRVKSERVCIPFKIVHNATPASKTNSNDLAAAMTLSLQGQTATAAAIDSGCNFTAAQDAASAIFGILLSGLGTVAKVQQMEVKMLSSGTATVALNGASSTGVTASGNVAASVTWSGDLTTTDLSGTLCVDYTISKA